MSMLPNPFNPAASDAAAGQAVASLTQPPARDAAADLSDSGDTDCPPDEAAAALRQEDAAVDLIAEIFVGARKLNLPPFKLDVERFMADIEEVPLFLRQAVG